MSSDILGIDLQNKTETKKKKIILTAAINWSAPTEVYRVVIHVGYEIRALHRKIPTPKDI